MRCDLDYKAADLRAKAWSSSTWKTKASQWKRFINFSPLIVCAASPTTPLLMCRYIVHLCASLKYSTIQNYVSGVLSLNQYFGYDVKSIRSDFNFIMTMAGIRRSFGDPEPVRPTLTLPELLSMYDGVDKTSQSERCMWACIALSFRSLLRKSNLVPDDSSSLDGHYLRRGAITFTKWGLELLISSSKTIQYAQRTHKIPITKADGSPLCAARLLFEHLSETGISDPNAPAFLIKKGDRWVPLTYSKLLNFIKALLDRAKIPKDRVGMHSLRRAGALYMYRIVLTLEDIRQAGDWRSMAALLYLTKPYSGCIESDIVVSDCLRAAFYIK